MDTIILIIQYIIIFAIIAAIFFIYEYRKVKCTNKPGIILSLEFNQIKIEGVITMLGMKVQQKVTATLKPVDRLGNPAQVEPGTVVFGSSDDSVFTVEQSDTNELECTILSTGVGTAQFDFSADADLGDGVNTITGFSAVEVLPLDAIGFGIEFSDPVDV